MAINTIEMITWEEYFDIVETLKTEPLGDRWGIDKASNLLKYPDITKEELYSIRVEDQLHIRDNHACWLGASPDELRVKFIKSGKFNEVPDFADGVVLYRFIPKSADEYRTNIRDPEYKGGKEVKDFNGITCHPVMFNGGNELISDRVREVYKIATTNQIPMFTTIPDWSTSPEDKSKRHKLSGTLVAYNPSPAS